MARSGPLEIIFDHGPSGRREGFADPEHVIHAWSPRDVPAAFAAMDAAQKAGRWLAGYASYELGYALEPRLSARVPGDRRLPLLAFGVYAGAVAAWPTPAGGRLGRLRPRWDAERYGRAFDRLHALIGAGDLYQANLTFPVDVDLQGDSRAVYAALAAAQPVGHGALVVQDTGPDLLSRSPELFFRTTAAGGIETRPMKGTQPRSADPSADAAMKAFLTTDEKNLAENLMIVDLLRNDISRISVPGSVKVPDLFQVESYATVHQMVSRVTARLQPDVRLGAILRALFPCGSVTGAPKVRAMEVLADLEPWPREAYCGAIGWAAPDGRSEFNVAIRTLMVEDGRATLNVGGGVVWDSSAASEYEEALWKARFARQTTPTSA